MSGQGVVGVFLASPREGTLTLLEAGKAAPRVRRPGRSNVELTGAQ